MLENRSLPITRLYPGVITDWFADKLYKSSDIFKNYNFVTKKLQGDDFERRATFYKTLLLQMKLKSTFLNHIFYTEEVCFKSK